MKRALGLAAALAVCLVVAGSSSAATQESSGALVEHWDGTAWTRVLVAGADDLGPVVAVSATDVWAFGTVGIKTPVAEHWDGSSWQEVAMPAPTSDSEVELYGAAAASATDIWVVGTWAGSGAVGYRSLIEHWDGASWKVVRSPNPTVGPVQLHGVAVLSRTNAWAVGWSEGPRAPTRTLVLHWNGQRWKRVASPNPSDLNARQDDSLAAVAVVSPRDVWVVGEYFHRGARHHGSKPRRSYVTLVLHWDGRHWTHAPSPNPGRLGHENALDAVAADPAGHLWAAGGYRDGTGLESPLVERRVAGRWRTVHAPAPDAAAPDLALYSLAPLAANDVWAAGTYVDDSRDLTPLGLVEHWDGHAWKIVPTPDPVDPYGFEALFGIAAVSTDDIWIVGRAGIE